VATGGTSSLRDLALFIIACETRRHMHAPSSFDDVVKLVYMENLFMS
jgi:hypothetical protein